MTLTIREDYIGRWWSCGRIVIVLRNFELGLARYWRKISTPKKRVCTLGWRRYFLLPTAAVAPWPSVLLSTPLL